MPDNEQESSFLSQLHTLNLQLFKKYYITILCYLKFMTPIQWSWKQPTKPICPYTHVGVGAGEKLHRQS